MYLVEVITIHYYGSEVILRHWSDAPYGGATNNSWWAWAVVGIVKLSSQTTHYKDSGSAAIDALQALQTAVDLKRS